MNGSPYYYYPYLTPVQNNGGYSQWGYVPNPPSYQWGYYTRDAEADRAPLGDYGPQPFVVNIEKAAEHNNAYRRALWTGRHLQVTLMSINVGDDIGLEVHPHTDQFIRIEGGQGIVQMGDHKDHLSFQQTIYDDYAIMIPAGKWHNVTNTGNTPLKLYSIYAPPHHPHGTVQETKMDAMAEEHPHSRYTQGY